MTTIFARGIKWFPSDVPPTIFTPFVLQKKSARKIIRHFLDFHSQSMYVWIKHSFDGIAYLGSLQTTNSAVILTNQVSSHFCCIPFLDKILLFAFATFLTDVGQVFMTFKGHEKVAFFKKPFMLPNWDIFFFKFIVFLSWKLTWNIFSDFQTL